MNSYYKQTYDKNYFNGNKSFFWKAGYGGYGRFSARYFDNLFRPIVPLLPQLPTNARVLDIGCAYGFMLERFPTGFQKYGTDVSKHAISEAKKRFPDYHFAVGDAEQTFPFKPNYFDLIICNDVLEHLEQPQLLLRNAYKILKPGGLLYLTTPNFNLPRKLLFTLPDRLEHHISLFPHQKLLTLFRKEKFTIVNHWTFINLFIYLRCNGNCGVESAVVASK